MDKDELNLDINKLKQEILDIYNDLKRNNTVRKLGLIDHDVFQIRLKELGIKYGFEVVTEYVGKWFTDSDTRKSKRGRIDVTYFHKNKPFIAIEIDSGLKKSSLKKLSANNIFQYKIWFCYKNNLDMQKYKNTIDKYDIHKDIVCFTPFTQAS